MRRRLRTIHASVRLASALAVLVCASPTVAAPLARADVPEPLRPWVEWVLRGHEAEACPVLAGAGTARCVWPTRLDLKLAASSGRFEQQFFVDAESTVLLPGGPEHWPEEVRVNGRLARVVAGADRRPALRLARGRHRVSGRFVWRELPQLLAIPPDTGLVALTLEGEEVPFPSRDAKGRLWLRERAAKPAAAENHLEVEVHRQVVDEIPLRLLTEIDLRVAGESREELLGRALPEGFVLIALGAGIPARLEPDGRLRVQVRPGRWRLTLDARHEGPVTELVLPAQSEADPGVWDASEVWVFDARPGLRLVEVEGPASIDPTQTELPPAWRSLPAYQMESGDRMRLVEKRRGSAGPARDELHLSRSWHVDFDGGGATVADRIHGTMRAHARLEMGAATRIGRAAVNGRDQPITSLDGSGEGEDPVLQAGIEVPLGAVRVDADSRVEGSARRLPAVGWDHDFASLDASLELPPGWQLFHVSGADRASSSWIGRWTLLDLFLVMVIAMAFLRLFGPLVGALAGVTLALTYTEGGAPQLVWVAVLAAEALRRVVPSGRISTLVGVARVASLAVLVLMTVPFAAHQIRLGLFPALERPWAMVTDRQGGEEEKPLHLLREGASHELRTEQVRGLGYVTDAAERAPAESPAASAPQGAASKRGRARAGSPARAYSYAPDPDARIPTGPGRPDWHWETVRLEWSGPVERGQQLGLWLVPPWAVALLAMIRSGLLLALVGVVLKRASDLASRWRPTAGGVSGVGRAAAGAGAAAMALVLALSTVQPASAEIPSKELLEELRGRLLERSECHPSCVSMARLELRVRPSLLTARLEVAAAEETALPLPGSATEGGFVPDVILVDGKPAEGLLRTADGRLWLRVAKGNHQVDMRGPLPPRESIELPLPWRPHRVDVVADGWTVQGLREDGRVEGALQLVRERDDTGAEPASLELGRVPPFVRVTRDIRLGLSWQVHTSVERVAPLEGAIVIEVPLLPGESVTTAGVQVKEGRALVSLQPGSRTLRWNGVLPVTSSLRLAAPGEVPWTEIWRVDTSPLWHMESGGIPWVETQGVEGRRLREWRPWPGEVATLQVTRPEGVAGSTLTVDSSRLLVRPGQRATQATLHLTLRSSQGGPYSITLPEGAELHSIAVNGREQPIRQEGRVVPLTLVPGTQEIALDWREPHGVGLVTRAPGVDLGLPSVNHHVEIVMPPSRWTLWTSGPRLGPAVLFWPVLGLLAALAVVLGRIRFTPLRARHWFLLGLGLTQVPVLASGCVVVWILALGWRRERGPALASGGIGAPLFDLMQLALVALTMTALAALFWSIQNGLLGLPEMQISGNGSSAGSLRWYQDRTSEVLPQPAAGSVSLWFYRLAMLAWSLWVAQALLGWLRWGWQCFSAGELWRSLRAPRSRGLEGSGQPS